MPTLTSGMYRVIDRSPLGRLLKAAMGMSLTCAIAMLAVGLIQRDLGGSTGQALVSAVGILLASVAAYFLLGARTKAGPLMAIVLTGGLAVSGAWVACHLGLVWSGSAAGSLLWRLWWLSMTFSAGVAMVAIVQTASLRRGGGVEVCTCVMAAWTALMLMWLGLRGQALTGVPTAYWWSLTFPALCTGGGMLYVLTRRVLGSPRPGHASRVGAAALLILTHLAAAVCAYEVGRAVHQPPAQTSRETSVRQ